MKTQFLAAVLFALPIAIAGCSASSPSGTAGGSGGSSNSGTGGTTGSGTGGGAGGFGGSGPAAACVSTLNAGGRTGSAKINYMNQMLTLPERACETLRRPDGVAIGWSAYYGAPPTKQVPQRQYPAFSVTVTRGFTGDGVYDSGDFVDGNLALEWFIILGEVGSGTASPSSVTLSNGGKSAVLDVADIIHAELSCDPADDTGTSAIAAIDAKAAPPGFAYLVDKYGAFHKFDCAHCSSFLKTLSVEAPSVAPDFYSAGFGSHTFFHLSNDRDMEVTGPGTYQFQGRVGWRTGSRDFVATVDVKAVKPGAGTFTVHEMLGDLSGSFQCPSDSF